MTTVPAPTSDKNARGMNSEPRHANKKAPSTKSSGLAVSGLFFANGAVFSNWVPRIPDVRDRLGMDNGGLGATLIGGGLGGIVGSLLVAKFLQRIGSRRLVLIAASTLALLLPVVAIAPTPLALVAVLTALGFADVMNDMAMNTQGTIVQDRLTRSIMQRLHGAWSLGAACGAGTGALAAANNISVGVHLSIVAVVLLGVIAAVMPNLIRHDPRQTASKNPGALDATMSRTSNAGPRKRPSAFRITPTIAALVVMAIGMAFAESAPSEWSAVTMRDVFSFGSAGAATVVFAASMLIARLFGDHLVDRLGPQRVLDLALAVSLIGFAIIVTAQAGVVALVGFSVCGFGAAVMFPQLYAMAATMPGTAAGAGLGALGIGQRFGFMMSSLLVGTIADWKNLRWSFTVIALLAATAIVSSRTVLRGKVRHGGAA